MEDFLGRRLAVIRRGQRRHHVRVQVGLTPGRLQVREQVAPVGLGIKVEGQQIATFSRAIGNHAVIRNAVTDHRMVPRKACELPAGHKRHVLSCQHVMHDIGTGHTDKSSRPAGVVGMAHVEWPVEHRHDPLPRWA